MLKSKAGEIEGLLAALAAGNEAMGRAIGDSGGSRAHTLARHRDILRDYSQEFRRQSSVAGAARDRADLIGGASVPLSVAPGSGAGLLLRERGAVASSHAALDEVLGTAHGVASSLGQQRDVFEGTAGKLAGIGAAFPVVNTLLNAIRRKKNKDNLILGGVIAACIFFILVYWANK